MKVYHKTLVSGRWFQLSLVEQLANIGSEIERAVLWQKKNLEYSYTAVERALELLSLTLEDEKNKKFAKLKEIARLKELILDYFYNKNAYNTEETFWQKYFYPFYIAARGKKI